MKNDIFIEKAELILEKVGYEKDQKSQDNSIGYFEGIVNGKVDRRWILRKEKASSYNTARDIHDCAISTYAGNQNSVYQRNETIYRDSPLGRFICEGLGEYTHTTLKGEEIKILIELLSTYSSTEKGDVINGSIKLNEGNQEFSFRSLIQDLKELKELEAKNTIIKQKLEGLDEQAAFKLQNELDENYSNISKLKKKVLKYISQEVALRDQPILDKYQEDVKRSKILDGTLIINGGPGTGKTTSLIQRINYLTSPTLQEEVGDFNQERISILLNQQKSWVFYSPSELLRDYLSNAMIAEGLEADQDRVLTWDTHRKMLLRETGLINLETKKPFIRKKNKEGDTYFIQTSKVYKELNDLFMRYILDKQSAKIQKIHNSDVFSKLSKVLDNSVADNYRMELIKLAIKMKDSSFHALKYRKLDTWVPFFINFQKEFSSKFKEINSILREDIKKEVSLLQIKIENDLELNDWLIGVIEEERISSLSDEDLEDELEEELEDEFEIESNGNESNKRQINRKLTSLIRSISLSYIDSSNTKITSKNRILFEKTKKYLNRDKLVSLGIRLYFKKYFEKPVKGLEINLFSEIPTTYKVFRRTILKDETSCLTPTGIIMCNKALNNRNKYIYNEEADYILAVIFNLCKALYKNQKKYFNNSQHTYVSTFRRHMKGVVAVDEATDFSLWELVAMSSLSHPLFNSVTLSGDLMQRFTNKGITNWKEYKNIVTNTEIRDLKIAYRQTAKLLDVASEIYSWNVSSPAEFEAHYKSDPIDPDPLVYITEDEDDKIDWLVKRIMEIQRVYGSNFPTVAIFVKDDSEVSRIAKLLDDSDVLEEAGIEVRACINGQILGNKQDIRIFSVEYIKGLEFGAVFFLDIDKLKDKNEALINKYIYVGLSRANLFLGITLSNDFSDGLQYLSPLFKCGNWNELGMF